MRLDVSKALAAEGNEIPFTCAIRLPELFMFGESIRFDSPATLEGTYVSVGETVKVRGTLSFAAGAICSLCLKPMETLFQVPVEAEYALSTDIENPDVYHYDGAWIDLSGMATDAVALALPIQWRCGARCKGLCPVCGANRNLSECACNIKNENNRPFAKLSWNDNQNEV